MNQLLEKQAGMMPKVSLSVGVAFSDRKGPTGTIFQDADQARYDRKEHGKCGCTFYKHK